MPKMALVLQGGGALGAYEYGAVCRLVELGWEPVAVTDIFSSVTRVPSTSASTSEILRFSAIGFSGTSQSSGRQARPSRVSSSSAATGPVPPAA